MSESFHDTSQIDACRFIKTDSNPESLMRLSLVRQLLQDKAVKLSSRRVDRRWLYDGFVPVSLSGFNPSSGNIYYSCKSALAEWFQYPHESARLANEGDFLVPELMFAVHDYLHVWSYQIINELFPNLEFGYGEITRTNSEILVFAHLVTEAVATVGLDYWYLSQFDFNKAIPIGTQFRHLTVSYSVSHIEEYRRFHSSLSVENPSFLIDLATFYCTGIFEGFSVQDLKHSPVLCSWLRHEIEYGVKQRRYTRMWLQHLSSIELGYNNKSLSKPVKCNEPWMTELLGELAIRLWRKVVEDIQDPTPVHIPMDRYWKSDKLTDDFRFINLAQISDETLKYIDLESLSPVSFNFFKWQYISAHDYDSTDQETRRLLRSIRGVKDIDLLRYLLRTATLLCDNDHCPRDLFLIN